MDGRNSRQNRYLKFMATALLGLTLIALAAQPAESARWRGRGWARGWGGYRAYRMPYRGVAGVYPRYGSRAVAPRVYNSYYRYGGAGPAGYGYGGYAAPIAPGAGYYGYYNYVPPML